MSEERKQEIIKILNSVGVDSDFLISETFLGYKQRKKEHKLYTDDANIPTQLIKLYYALGPSTITFDNMKKAFITKYASNESKIEGVNDTNIHNSIEVKGLRKMYEYIHSDDIEYMFDVYTLCELHRQLFSYTEFPEYAGLFRNFDVYLPGTGTELSEWDMIRPTLNEIDKEVQELRRIAPIIRRNNDINGLMSYLDRCVIVGCRLIKVHPFSDGNGRTIRGFVNKLFEDIGLPPIYIKTNERFEYHTAMNKANNEGDYTEIKAFYRYKVCDSIIELDINERVNKNSPKKRVLEPNK